MSSIPPSIRLLGDALAAAALIGRAKNELRILTEQMGFRSLFQASRTVQDSAGRWIKCDVYGSLSYISIFCPPGRPGPRPVDLEQPIHVMCWCTCCFGEGEIVEVSHADAVKYPHGQRGNWGSYAEDDAQELDPYPDLCNETDASIRNYNGVRYVVQVCSNVGEGIFDPYQLFCCTSTDFAEYEVGDRVILIFRGHWVGETLVSACAQCASCLESCQAGAREDLNPDDPRPDGAFVIFPVMVETVNDEFSHAGGE